MDHNHRHSQGVNCSTTTIGQVTNIQGTFEVSKTESSLRLMWDLPSGKLNWIRLLDSGVLHVILLHFVCWVYYFYTVSVGLGMQCFFVILEWVFYNKLVYSFFACCSHGEL